LLYPRRAFRSARVRVPTAPGLGVALTEEIIAKYR
jgi:L-alanine-DL-glutamate epimerase-like enolase superfamily enzyme